MDNNSNILKENIYNVEKTPTSNEHTVPEMSVALRNIIVDLLKNGSVLYDLDSEEYNLLRQKDTEKFIRSFLRNINIDLVIAPDTSLAYIRNLDRVEEKQRIGAPTDDDNSSEDNSDDEENKANDKLLITRTMLTPYKAVLLLILRKFYQERFSKGESKIVIDIDYLKNMLIPYIEANASENKDNKKLSGALKDFADYHLVKKLPSEEGDRYQILPLIRYVVDANKLENMLEKFKELNNEEPSNLSQKANKSDNTKINNAAPEIAHDMFEELL